MGWRYGLVRVLRGIDVDAGGRAEYEMILALGNLILIATCIVVYIVDGRGASYICCLVLSHLDKLCLSSISI